MNKVIKGLISWLKKGQIQLVMAKFKTWCGLFFMQSAINGFRI